MPSGCSTGKVIASCASTLLAMVDMRSKMSARSPLSVSADEQGVEQLEIGGHRAELFGVTDLFDQPLMGQRERDVVRDPPREQHIVARESPFDARVEIDAGVQPSLDPDRQAEHGNHACGDRRRTGESRIVREIDDLEVPRHRDQVRLRDRHFERFREVAEAADRMDAQAQRIVQHHGDRHRIVRQHAAGDRRHWIEHAADIEHAGQRGEQGLEPIETGGARAQRGRLAALLGQLRHQRGILRIGGHGARRQCATLPGIIRGTMSDISAGTVKPINSPAQVLFASLIGTTIEFFDFYIYATAAVLVFPPLFFPKSDPASATLASLATFAIAFVARPIGSALFGHFGDRIGRKTTLVAALLTMGLSTVTIGLLPTYATIGLAAPLLLAICRFGQGLGLGGEWGGAVLLAVENAPPGKRAPGTACSRSSARRSGFCFPAASSCCSRRR